MKTTPTSFRRRTDSEQGSAIIVVMTLLGIMTLLLTANNRNLIWLQKEIKMVDQRQTARLAATNTNQPAASLSTGQSATHP